MIDLIEALNILMKYSTGDIVCCEHDVMYVHVDPEHVLYPDVIRLQRLSFQPNRSLRCFQSFRFGSC